MWLGNAIFQLISTSTAVTTRIHVQQEQIKLIACRESHLADGYIRKMLHCRAAQGKIMTVRVASNKITRIL